jgi:hypothetical protein
LICAKSLFLSTYGKRDFFIIVIAVANKTLTTSKNKIYDPWRVEANRYNLWLMQNYMGLTPSLDPFHIKVNIKRGEGGGLGHKDTRAILSLANCTVCTVVHLLPGRGRRVQLMAFLHGKQTRGVKERQTFVSRQNLELTGAFVLLYQDCYGHNII